MKTDKLSVTRLPTLQKFHNSAIANPVACSLKTRSEKKTKKMKHLNPKPSVFDLLRSDLETAFNDSFLNPYFASQSPLVNIHEGEKEVQLEMAIPGFKKSDLEISLDNCILTIKGKKQSENQTENTKTTRKEFVNREFTRSFKIDPSLHDESITSKLEDGILTIQIPRANKVESKKKISIA